MTFAELNIGDFFTSGAGTLRAIKISSIAAHILQNFEGPQVIDSQFQVKRVLSNSDLYAILLDHS